MDITTRKAIVSPGEIYRWAVVRNGTEKTFAGLYILLGVIFALQAWRQFRRFKRQQTPT